MRCRFVSLALGRQGFAKIGSHRASGAKNGNLPVFCMPSFGVTGRANRNQHLFVINVTLICTAAPKPLGMLGLFHLYFAAGVDVRGTRRRIVVSRVDGVGSVWGLF